MYLALLYVFELDSQSLYFSYNESHLDLGIGTLETVLFWNIFINSSRTRQSMSSF